MAARPGGRGGLPNLHRRLEKATARSWGVAEAPHFGSTKGFVKENSGGGVLIFSWSCLGIQPEIDAQFQVS